MFSFHFSYDSVLGTRNKKINFLIASITALLCIIIVGKKFCNCKSSLDFKCNHLCLKVNFLVSLEKKNKKDLIMNHLRRTLCSLFNFFVSYLLQYMC